MKNLFIFTIGAGIGASVVAIILKKKLDEVQTEANEAISEAREHYKNKLKEVTTDEEKEENKDAEVYEDMVSDYTNNFKDEPYIIKIKDFRTIDEYEDITITYYTLSKIFAYENGDVIDDISDVIGDEAIDRFMKPRSRTNELYVRNDIRRTDYEILRDDGEYPY